MEEATENSAVHKTNKSIFHNFQKQLVITLKSNIKFDKINLKKCPAATLAGEIWTLFLESKNYSKKILHNVFGVVNPDREENNTLKKKDTLPDFIDIFRSNTDLEIS